MTCDDLAERLTDFLEGELDDAQTDAAIEHVASCPRCETVLADTKLVIDAGRRHGRLHLDSDHQSELLASILAAQPL